MNGRLNVVCVTASFVNGVRSCWFDTTNSSAPPPRAGANASDDGKSCISACSDRQSISVRGVDALHRPSALSPTTQHEWASFRVDYSTTMGIYDVTARKAHQWTMVGLVVVGFILGEPRGALLLAFGGAVMLVGRFWWPADLVRQFVWRVAEPAGWLPRRDREEDHATRRVARVLGGLVWLVCALLVLAGASTAAWVMAGLIAIMVVLDASVDFCALCFVAVRLDRLGLKVS